MSTSKAGYETLITFRVLSSAPVGAADLAQLLEECDTGDCVGHVESRTQRAVGGAELHGLLLKAGNDGTFFGDLDAQQQSEADGEERSFVVSVTRTEAVTKDISVVARSAEEARHKAVDQAGGIDFGRSGDATYEADSVSQA